MHVRRQASLDDFLLRSASVVTDFSIYMAVASLCARCLPLAVETGRYRTPKVPLGEGYTGKLCNNGKVKTEFHFVMECSKLQTCEMSYSLLYPNVTHVLCTLIYLTSFYMAHKNGAP